jgi:hypothetical protein
VSGSRSTRTEPFGDIARGGVRGGVATRGLTGGALRGGVASRGLTGGALRGGVAWRGGVFACNGIVVDAGSGDVGGVLACGAGGGLALGDATAGFGNTGCVSPAGGALNDLFAAGGPAPRGCGGNEPRGGALPPG